RLLWHGRSDRAPRTLLVPLFSGARIAIVFGRFGHAARLSKTPISRLPLPVYTPQLFAPQQQKGPKDVKDAPALPAAKGAIDADRIAELFGQKVPLTAGSHPKQDAIQGLALVYARTPHARGRIVDEEHFAHRFPQSIGHFPDGGQGWHFRLGFRH